MSNNQLYKNHKYQKILIIKLCHIETGQTLKIIIQKSPEFGNEAGKINDKDIYLTDYNIFFHFFISRKLIF